MPDPLTALGLASNVAQLITFTADVVCETRNLLQSSSDNPPSFEELSKLAEDQHKACERIAVNATRSEFSAQTDVEVTVQSCAKQSAAEAKKIVDILRGIAVKPRQDGKKRFGAALWSVTKANRKVRRSRNTREAWSSASNS